MSNTLIVTEVVNSVTVTPINNTVTVSSVGLQGAKGDKGDTGATGATGSSGVVTVNAPITNAGTSSAANLSVSTGSTSAAGVLQLTDSISSTSTTTAATPNSVKTTYDLATLNMGLLTPISGAYYRTSTANATASQSASVNVTSYTPIQFNTSVTLDRIAIQTASSFSGTASVRLGIFANSSNKPGTLILDAGTVAPIAASTSYSITINQTLSAGIYWVAMNSITAATTNNYFGSTNTQATNNTLFGGALTSTTASSGAAGYSQSYTATTAFANASSPSLTASAPFTYVRVA